MRPKVKKKKKINKDFLVLLNYKVVKGARGRVRYLWQTDKCCSIQLIRDRHLQTRMVFLSSLRHQKCRNIKVIQVRFKTQFMHSKYIY